MKILDELKLRVRAASGPGGMADYFHILLMEGGLKKVVEIVDSRPELLADLLPIVGNPDASMNVSLGASAVFERYARKEPLRVLVMKLGKLSEHADARVRADACHYLGLSGSQLARSFLEPRLQDDSTDVREIAADGLAELGE
ncbi:MAG: HEAT repeat domain-containing protein [Rhodocyclales bacterium]|nr:HEAT repeat domain-containing protein [Rhodocyclales bacterium]